MTHVRSRILEDVITRGHVVRWNFKFKSFVWIHVMICQWNSSSWFIACCNKSVHCFNVKPWLVMTFHLRLHWMEDMMSRWDEQHMAVQMKSTGCDVKSSNASTCRASEIDIVLSVSAAPRISWRLVFKKLQTSSLQTGATSVRVSVPFAGPPHLSGPPKLSGPAFFSDAPQEQGLPPPQNEQNALASAILLSSLQSCLLFIMKRWSES